MGKFNNDRGGGFNKNRGGFGGGNRFSNNRGADRGPVTMYDATCDECKRPCQVPFRPNGDKPVYCKNCFDKRGGGREQGRFAGAAGNVSPGGFSVNDIKTQLAMINIKLDKLLERKEIIKETPIVEEIVKEKKVAKVKKISKK
jgi:CxxC-x17-CxxC domain-containing protein